MTHKPIDLFTERRRYLDAANAPNSDCLASDPQGLPMGLFIITWTLGGRTQSTQIAARDWAHAEAQVAAMRASLALEGQLLASIEVDDFEGTAFADFFGSVQQLT